MNNINELLVRLDAQEKLIAKQRQALIELQLKLEGFPKKLNLSLSGYSPESQSIDFDFPGRAETVELITFLKAGKWDKALSNSEGKIDYINKHLISMKLRIYAAEPPGSCKIIETEVEIPAQPARKIIRKTLQCTEHSLAAV
jgi:hypothetical protein